MSERCPAVVAVLLGVGLALLLPGRTALANGFDFPIKQVAAIDPERATDSMQVETGQPKVSAGAKSRVEKYKVMLVLGDGRRIRLDSYSRSHYDEGISYPVREGIDPETVRYGWLAGAPDLLFVAWSDYGDPPGTGHYLGRSHVVCHVPGEGDPRVLIRHFGVVAGSSKHVRDSGIMTHHFAYDPAECVLTERIRHWQWPGSGGPRPLYYLSQDAEGSEYVADIHQTVLHRYRYEQGRLEHESIRLLYRVQDSEWLRDIASHYLGPYAPGECIYEANPMLKEKHAEAPHPAFIRPGAGTELVIPVPEDWLLRRYGTAEPPDEAAEDDGEG